MGPWNKLGFRGPVPETPRPTGTERILVVGDSSFFGFGVSDGETLHYSLARALLERGVQADVINGAIPGYSIAQTRLWLEDKGWSLEPTLLIVANLWSDNNIDAFRDRDLLHSRRFAHLNPLAHSDFIRLLASFLPTTETRVVTWNPKTNWPGKRTRRVPVNEYVAML